MKDHLENFVQKNRDAFDDKNPPEKIWKTIEATLPQKRTASWWNSVVVWRAAAIVFMAISAYALIPKSILKQSNNDFTLRDFNDVENFYVEQISEKTELIDALQKSEDMNGFTHDFKQLEAMYSVLKEEMKIHPSKKVKEALVLNLLIRIDLLNQQLHALDKASDKEKTGEKEGANI